MYKLIKFVMVFAEIIYPLHFHPSIVLLVKISMITTIKLIPSYKGYNIVTKSISRILDYGENAVEVCYLLAGNLGGLL